MFLTRFTNLSLWFMIFKKNNLFNYLYQNLPYNYIFIYLQSYKNLFTYFKLISLKIPKILKKIKHINFFKYSNSLITLLPKKGLFIKFFIQYNIIIFFIYKYLYTYYIYIITIYTKFNIDFFLITLLNLYKPIFFFNFIRAKKKKKKIIL